MATLLFHCCLSINKPRLTRLATTTVKTAASLRFVCLVTVRNTVPSSVIRRTLLLSLRKFSVAPIRKTIPLSYVKRPILPAMNPNPPESGEDFVHVENPNPDNVVALSESIISSPGGDEARNEDNDAVSPETRRILPEDLSRSVVLLTCESSAEGGNCDVYIVGTAHVSKVMDRFSWIWILVILICVVIMSLQRLNEFISVNVNLII